MSKIIDSGVAEKDLGLIFKLGGLMLILTASGAIAAVFRNIISSTVSQRFGAELRADLFKKILSFSFSNIDKFENASLITRLTGDITMMQNFAMGLMRIFVRAPLLCIGSIIMAVSINPRMSAVVFVIVPVIITVIAVNLKIGFPFFKRVQQSLDDINSTVMEFLSGIRVIKAFNRLIHEKEKFEKVNDVQYSASVNAMRTMSFFSPGIGLVLNLGIVSVLWFGGILTGKGRMQVGQIMAFINYMTQILFSLMIVSMVFTTFVRAKVSYERIKNVFNEKSNDMTANKIDAAVFNDNSITFENVYFNYCSHGGNYILSDITFSCRHGETLGIIGSTGSGKTSLVNLIPGFYKIDSGNIKIGGTDIDRFDIGILRKNISIVPQKTILFTGTIIDNIRWGKENASEEEVLMAANAACAHEFISRFPEGYGTILGQGGVNLSGGQKQRIAIARALIRRPGILLLDDCTSAVDVVTESKIRKSLKKNYDGLTMIIISQRIASIAGADRIIVLDDGKIAGTGNHFELMNYCRIYREIYGSQIGGNKK